MSATDPSRMHRHPVDGALTEVDAPAPHDVTDVGATPAPAHAAPLPGRPRRRVVAQVVVAVGLLLAVVGTVVGHAVWGPDDDGGGSPLEGPGWRDVEAPGDAAPAPTPDPEVVEPVSMPTTTTTEAPAPSPTSTTTEPPATTTTTAAPAPTTTTTVEPTTTTTEAPEDDDGPTCARTGTQEDTGGQGVEAPGDPGIDPPSDTTEQTTTTVAPTTTTTTGC